MEEIVIGIVNIGCVGIDNVGCGDPVSELILLAPYYSGHRSMSLV